MAVDLFGNPSNDYINPDVAQCAGASDTNTFEFLPNEQVGIVSGSSIISAMNLGDISQPVEGWVQQTKTLQPGEVAYIQGLTKGISNRIQHFLFDGSVVYTNTSHSSYLSTNLRINYYNNFRYYDVSLYATADPANGVTIDSALNIALGNLGITVTAAYDASGLTFTGDVAGYSYNVTTLDVSLFQYDTSTRATLAEDVSTGVPAFKYPNSAMLGYVLRVIYPTSTTIYDYQKYVEINHVPDYLEYFEASTGGCYSRYYKSVDVGLNSGLLCAGNTTIMSAGDYLSYVQEHNLWEKVGVLKIWLSAVDPDDSNVENLITGFYVFNPQTFAVQISYMTIV
jgi:hypothetical protein